MDQEVSFCDLIDCEGVPSYPDGVGGFYASSHCLPSSDLNGVTVAELGAYCLGPVVYTCANCDDPQTTNKRLF